MNLNSFLDKFVLGRGDAYLSVPERKNELTCRIALICTVLCFPYYFIFDYFSLHFAKSFVIPTVLIYVVSLLLNKYKYYSLSKWILIIGTSVSLFFYANVLGPSAGAQLLLFALVPLPLLLFNITQLGWLGSSLTFPVFAYFMLEFGQYHWLPYMENVSDITLGSIRFFAVLTTFLLLILSAAAYFISNHRYELRLLETNTNLSSNNIQLEDTNLRLKTAYEDLQAQQNLLEKTWQEYGFTSKLSGTLRLSEIVDLTAKTILLHFGITYAATITSNNTSTLHTWTLENQIPVRTREDSFESHICYTYEKGPILPLSVAHLSTSVLDIMNPTPSLVLHLAITENESRYMLIGPKNSGVAFSESDMKLLNALSTQAIIALQRALPYEEAVNRYGMAIKQESAYQMLVSLQHQINSPLSAAKMAMDTLSKTPMETNMSIITKIGKEALDSVAAVMRRMRQVSQLKETNYLGDIKMWDIGDPDET